MLPTTDSDRDPRSQAKALPASPLCPPPPLCNPAAEQLSSSSSAAVPPLRCDGKPARGRLEAGGRGSAHGPRRGRKRVAGGSSSISPAKQSFPLPPSACKRGLSAPLLVAAGPQAHLPPRRCEDFPLPAFVGGDGRRDMRGRDPGRRSRTRGVGRACGIRAARGGARSCKREAADDGVLRRALCENRGPRWFAGGARSLGRAGPEETRNMCQKRPLAVPQQILRGASDANGPEHTKVPL